MLRPCALILGLGLLSASPLLAVERWGIYEVTLHGPSSGDPFDDVKLSARFQQGDKTVQVTGFYDGEGTYRVRFMPDAVGDWSYTTQSNVAELSGKTGSFTADPATGDNHGPVGVAHTYHFAYADGKPFHQIGTTCYSWAFAGDAREAQTLETLKASPFNKIRMCVLPQDFVPAGQLPYDHGQFNPAFFRHLEERVGQLRDLGVEADLILFHPYDKHWKFSNLSPDQDERYVRYVVARFAAFRNVWWSLANEYDFIRWKPESEWDRLFQAVADADPYAHLRSIHNGDKLYNNTKPWVTHASIQNGAAVEDPERAEEYRDVYRKPIVYDEVKYEGDIARRWGNLSGEELVSRFWNGTIAGTYVGHSETFTKSYYRQHGIVLRDAEGSWLGTGGRLVGQSPPRLAFLRKVLEEGPAEGIDPIDKWQDERTGGQPGKYYLIYFGHAAPTSWAFKLYKAELKNGMRFRVDVLDTWNMTVTPAGEFTTRKKDSYYFGDVDGRSIPLPGRPYIALRVQRMAGSTSAGGPERH